MKNEPLVDVLVPAYRSRYLGEAIESVRAQTFQGWRLTVSDDSSPGQDDVRDVVMPLLSDERIRLHATSGGIGEMRNTNRLLRDADAPYVVVLHDDDRLHPAFLERRVEFMAAHPECGLCMSGCVVVDAAGQELWRWLKRVPAGVCAPETFAVRFLEEEGIAGPPVTVFARRDAYASAGDFVPRLPHSDHEMFLRLGLERPVGYLPGVDADYRIHAGSRSKVFRFPVREVVAFPDRLIALVSQALPHALDARSVREVRARWLLREIAFDFERAGGRWYETRLLLHAIVLDPRVVADARMTFWLKNLLGPRLRRTLRRHAARVAPGLTPSGNLGRSTP